MVKQIALFNHKGGVSKTTTTFNLGWMLANKGKRVIIVDCDPQCNLTEMVLGFKDAGNFASIYESKEVRNIRDGLAPAFECRPVLLEPVVCEPVKEQPNLYLLPGHIRFAEYEVVLGMAQELSGSIGLQNLPGSFAYLFSKTAEKYDADFILVDMGSSLGPINRNLLMTSDYFIVPMFPDYFSVMTTESLASIVSKWSAWGKKGRAIPILREATYPFPEKTPKFLGTIIQNYRVQQKKTPSAAFKNWIDAIETAVKTKLIPVLKENNMLLPCELYEKETQSNQAGRLLDEADADATVLGELLLQMPDFNSLIALSQEHKVPIFDLTDAQLERDGIGLEQTKKSMQKFRELYSEGADRIITLVENAEYPQGSKHAKNLSRKTNQSTQNRLSLR